MDILQIKYGDTAIPESWIFKGGEENRKVPIVLSYYLVITENKKILVDTGSDTMDGFELTNFSSPVKVLKEKGIDPDGITDIIITHAHHDHIESVKYYKNATVYIQKDEYESGKEYLKCNKNIVLFENEYNLTDDIKIIKIGGHTKGSSVVEIESNDKIYVIAGDECYSEYNLNNKIPTASSNNTENSKYFVEKYGDKNYKVLLIH